jgi:hypothetical protein
VCNLCLGSNFEYPEGYAGADDDETGQCITHEECESYDDYVLLEREDEGDRCAALYYLRNEDGQREEDYCIEFCNEDPNRMR